MNMRIIIFGAPWDHDVFKSPVILHEQLSFWQMFLKDLWKMYPFDNICLFDLICSDVHCTENIFLL